MKDFYERFTKRTLLTIIIVFFSMISFSASYYIDPKGNNSNNGSAGSPWLTLTYACAHAKTVGDIIHVNAGTYVETAQSLLAVGVSIEGDGNTSIIKSHVSTVNTYTGYAIHLLSDNEGTNGNQHISNIKMDGDNLTGYGAIRITRRSNVEIYNCYFQDFNYVGVNFMGGLTTEPTIYATGNSFHDNTIINCSGYFPAGIKAGGSKGLVGVNGQDGLLIYNNTIDQTSRAAGSNGYCIDGVEGYIKNVKIYNNTITKAPYDNLTWDFAIELWHIKGGVEIYNNRIIGDTDISDEANKGDSDYAVYFHDNIVGPEIVGPNFERGFMIEASVGYSCSDIIVRNNLFKNMTYAVVGNIHADGISIYNFDISYNIFNKVAGFEWLGSNGKTIDNVTIYNNVFYANGMDYSIAEDGIELPDQFTATNIYVKNNIVVGYHRSPVFAYKAQTGATIDRVYIGNNIFYSNGNSDVPLYATISPTNNTTQNNLTSNPLLVSTSDFHLRSGSPAINAGLNVGFPYIGTAPDIGAYEYEIISTDATSPVISAFSIPSTSTSITVPISSIAATDNIGVTGYLLTETSSTPTSSAAGWSSTKPTSYTFSLTGAKTLYAWAKDAAGNVSSSKSASVIISPPVATSFTFTGPSSGNVNNTSTNFTVTPNNIYTGTITITPSGTGSAGLSTIVLSFSNSIAAQNFTITPIVAGSITLIPTNNGSLTNPTNITYITNAVVPNAPTSVVATAGNASASVAYLAPTNTGGSAITGYTVTSNPAGGVDTNAGSTLLTHTITGLTNGTSYTFTVKATNSIGTSVASVASNSVTPKAPVATGFLFAGPTSGNVNSASTNFTVTPNNSYTGTITITPTGTGSAGLSAKVLTFSNSSTAQTFSITPTVAGSITLTPTNNGTLTNPANLIYTANAILPNAPTSVVATAGDASALVTFVAPTNTGGSAITGYTVTSIPAGGVDTNAGSTSLTHSIGGLTNGTSYTFTVKANNFVGSSVASIASNSITPKVADVITKQGDIIPSHFKTVWEGLNGLNHMNINVVSATLEDVPLSVDDEIAVFSGSKCVGATKLTKTIVSSDNTTFLSILASQDDGSGNGFSENDTIVFKIWDSKTQRELQVNGVVYRNDVSTWKTNGKYSPAATAVVEIASYNVITQSIELLKGYNMISTYVSVQNPNVSAVTKSLQDQGSLIKMQDETGNSLENWGDFGGWINQLGSMEETEGYKIQVANNCTLQVTGRSIAMPFDISLKTGWNIISYPRTDVVNAMNVFQALIDQNKLVKVQDEAGNSIENWGLFGGWKNGIGNLNPGKAYKVKISADAILTFQESYPKSAVVLAKAEETEYYHSSVEGNGTDHMNINITGINTIGISVGDEIAAFDGALCVATTKITEANVLSGSVSLASSFSTNDQNPDGFKVGDQIQISTWSKLSGDESKVNTEVVTGQMKYEKNATVLVKMKSATIATAITNLNDAVKIDVFPNPCQDQVTIRFSKIPEVDSRIEISDISGRKLITRPISGNTEEINLDSFTPGLYLVKSILGKNEYVQKLIVNK